MSCTQAACTTDEGKPVPQALVSSASRPTADR